MNYNACDLLCFLSIFGDLKILYSVKRMQKHAYNDLNSLSRRVDTLRALRVSEQARVRKGVWQQDGR